MSLNYCYNGVGKRRGNNPNFCSVSFVWLTRPRLFSPVGVLLLCTSKSDVLMWDLIQHPLKCWPHSRDKWIRSNLIRCFVSTLCTHTGICIFTCKFWQFTAKSPLWLLFKKHIQALLFFTFPPLPYHQDHTVSLPENIYDRWLAEDLSAHSSGMAHSVSDSNFSQY